MCSKEWEAKPFSLLNGEKCKCQKINKEKNKITFEEYTQIIIDKNIPVIPLTGFKSMHKKFLHQCKICGFQWETYPYNILKNHLCSKCNFEKKKKTHEQYVNEMYNINPYIEILSEYVGMDKKIKVGCKICGNKWEVLAKTPYSGCGCKLCGYELMKSKIRKSNQEFLNEINEINKNIEILDVYINNYTKINIKCKVCENKWNTMPIQLLDGHGCPECSNKKKRLSKEDFLGRVREYVDGRIEVFGEYTGLLSHYHCRCNICNFEWDTQGTILVNNHGCPKCSFSRGEKRITTFLDRNKIKYLPQYKFSGLKGVGNKLLSYDFYLPEMNLLIEYQGRQHDKPIEYFGGQEQFMVQQEHDKRKRDYAKEHNIELLEIWYYDENNIEEILIKYLNNLKLKCVETVIPI